MEKRETIAETMRAFMQSAPSIADFPSYKSLNDHVGKLHGLPAGKVQALAGPKAWGWHPDQETGRWRKSTEAEFNSKQAAAATKAHGGPRSKVLSAADRAALDAQVIALETVNNPALTPLLEGLKAKQAADDAARRGSLKDRLAAAVEALGIERAVALLEGAAEAPEAPEA